MRGQPVKVRVGACGGATAVVGGVAVVVVVDAVVVMVGGGSGTRRCRLSGWSVPELVTSLARSVPPRDRFGSQSARSSLPFRTSPSIHAAHVLPGVTLAPAVRSLPRVGSLGARPSLPEGEWSRSGSEEAGDEVGEDEWPVTLDRVACIGDELVAELRSPASKLVDVLVDHDR